MHDEHRCGPEHYPEFFDQIDAVFKKFPEAARKYSLKCTWHEQSVLKVDYAKVIGVSRIEGKKIITEFKKRADVDTKKLASPGGCCQYGQDANGKRICLAINT